MQSNLFEQLDFGGFQEYIDNEDITDISYTNNGQVWLRSLQKGSLRADNPKIDNALVEKLAFQCSNVMGVAFNNANPFLDAESPELRMNFVHESIATNGIALVIRKTPAKIRLEEEKLLEEDYVTKDIHDFLIKCVHGHCNIMVCGETGSGKTEFVKYLASHTKESEKLITIEDTLELHLDRIYPHRDIVSMKTNNIASYSEVLVTCMRQNPKWILLSEVRSAEAVSAVRNSISSGHNILSTIHSDKASAIPHRMYSLMETNLDVDQFLNTIYRYIQLGVHIKAYYSKKYGKFHREIDEITEFYIDEDNKPVYNIIYQKNMLGEIKKKQPSQHLTEYLAGQNIDINEPLQEEDNGLDFNKMDEVIEKPEPKEEIPLNPAMAALQSSINKNMSTDDDNSKAVSTPVVEPAEVVAPVEVPQQPKVDNKFIDNSIPITNAVTTENGTPTVSTEKVEVVPQVTVEQQPAENKFINNSVPILDAPTVENSVPVNNMKPEVVPQVAVEQQPAENKFINNSVPILDAPTVENSVPTVNNMQPEVVPQVVIEEPTVNNNNIENNTNPSVNLVNPSVIDLPVLDGIKG